MQIPLLCRRGFAVMAAFGLLAFSGWVSADPPSRVARLGYTAGAVSLSPAGEDDWIRATVNRPLTQGDRLWSDTGARAEVQIGGATIRMDADTGMLVLNLDDRIAQLQLTQGTLSVRVRRLAPGQVFEVDTPNLAFMLREPGEYRIEVDPDGNTTTIVVRQGQGEVYGEDASYMIDSRQPYRFTGTGLREYEYVHTPRLDDFDLWARARDRAYDNSQSARYVSRDVVGYQDLDANGTWRVDAQYGNVWMPNRVAHDWAPYRDGHWAWVDPWGWTWVDDALWGFAVSHYGRWANFSGRWGWVPGPVQTRAYYAPALVVFVGGANFQISISSGNVGSVGWFPLAPREVYRPSYPVSRGYFENVNRSNTVVNNTVITNTYNNTSVTNVVYVNRRVPGAVVAVPTTTFVQSQPVSKAVVHVTRDMAAAAPVAVMPHVAPTERSVRGAAGPGDKPPSRVFERPVVARTAPPVAPVGFAAQQAQLAAKPGRPLGDAERKALKPAAARPAPAVKVVAPARAAPPTARPPAVAPDRKADGRADGKADSKAEDERAQSDDRKAPAAPFVPTAPGPSPQPKVPPQATSTTPSPQTPEPRGKSAQPEPSEPRGQPAARPQATPPAPEAQPDEPRGKSEPRGKPETREPAAAPPPPQRAPRPTVAAPAATAPAPARAPAPAPAAQRAEPDGKPDARGKAEPHRQAAPSQRDAEPKAVPPPVSAPAQPPVVATPPPAPPRGKPEPIPAARPAEPHRGAAAPKAPPNRAASASQAEPRGQGSKTAPGKSGDKKKDGEES